ncbi:AAA family ATPase [Streptomyces herbicida]|uniref:AAA family ATPase n=1 Tax=Streptomyces herbicida TaxID=3065675 RepID=UPI00292F6DD0|nr:AAA family ATPase [Streptomyces sp. NEAU-HV9]
MPDRSAHHREQLAGRLAECRASMFVGRDDVLAVFRSAVAAAGPDQEAVIFVHGPGGTGKSTLLQRFADEARGAGRRVLQVNARDMEPSRQAFETRAGDVLDLPEAVLIVDNFEHCQGLEPWLAHEFLPRLPVGALVVLASRNAPCTHWRKDLGWSTALHVARLSDLRDAEARELLRRMRVRPSVHDTLIELTHGHPLALRLAAQIAQRADVGTMTWEWNHSVLRQLVECLVGDAPSPAHRHALEVCAHGLTTTEGLLRATLGEEAPALFAWLRRQPYVESGRLGLSPHSLVREILDADLRWRDPAGYQRMHERMSRHLLDEAEAATGSDVLPAVLAATYLHRHNGFVSRFLTWETESGIYEDACRLSDRAEVLRLIEAAEGPASARVAELWLDTQPSAFRVYRSADSSAPVAVMAWLRLTPDLADTVARDPVTAAAWEHLRSRRPLRDHEHFAVARFMVASGTYQHPSASMDLMIHRCVAQFLHSEHLAWSFISLASGPFWAEFMEYLDQRMVRDVISVGARRFTLYAHDWRVVTRKRWTQVGASIELAGPGAKPKPRPHEGAGVMTVLSREEFDKAVLDALDSRHRQGGLAASPLTRTRMVADRGDDDPVVSLRALLTEAVAALRADPRAEKYHRAVDMRFLRGAPTREAAAERLGLSVSTYQRHLKRGLERVLEHLWDRELLGRDAETQAC